MSQRSGVPAGLGISGASRSWGPGRLLSLRAPRAVAGSRAGPRRPFTRIVTGRTRYGLLASREGLRSRWSAVSVDSVEWTPLTLTLEGQERSTVRQGDSGVLTVLNGSAGAASLDAEVRVIQELKVGAHPAAIISVVSLEFTEQAQDSYTRAFISCQKRTTVADNNVFIYNRSPIIAPLHFPSEQTVCQRGSIVSVPTVCSDFQQILSGIQGHRKRGPCL